MCYFKINFKDGGLHGRRNKKIVSAPDEKGRIIDFYENGTVGCGERLLKNNLFSEDGGETWTSVFVFNNDSSYAQIDYKNQMIIVIGVFGDITCIPFSNINIK